jgi:hypothetical protein
MMFKKRMKERKEILLDDYKALTSVDGLLSLLSINFAYVLPFRSEISKIWMDIRRSYLSIMLNSDEFEKIDLFIIILMSQKFKALKGGI